jgi:hypothetical protein
MRTAIYTTMAIKISREGFLIVLGQRTMGMLRQLTLSGSTRLLDQMGRPNELTLPGLMIRHPELSGLTVLAMKVYLIDRIWERMGYSYLRAILRPHSQHVVETGQCEKFEEAVRRTDRQGLFEVMEKFNRSM